MEYSKRPAPTAKQLGLHIGQVANFLISLIPDTMKYQDTINTSDLEDIIERYMNMAKIPSEYRENLKSELLAEMVEYLQTEYKII